MGQHKLLFWLILVISLFLIYSSAIADDEDTDRLSLKRLRGIYVRVLLTLSEEIEELENRGRQGRKWMKVKLCQIGARLGIEIKLKSIQRKVLEQTIIPYYVARNDMKKILFVGCDYYTNHYRKFFKDKEFWTIEPDPSKKYFGSKNHIIDKLENLHLHFQHDYFDLIICNGVFGFGLNTKEQCEIAFQNCYDCLREHGEFILGWNDIPKYRPISLEEIESLARFNHQSLSPLSKWRYLVESPSRHTYDFYFKSIFKWYSV